MIRSEDVAIAGPSEVVTLHVLFIVRVVDTEISPHECTVWRTVHRRTPMHSCLQHTCVVDGQGQHAGPPMQGHRRVQL